jgi:hypothetical protein
LVSSLPALFDSLSHSSVTMITMYSQRFTEEAARAFGGVAHKFTAVTLKQNSGVHLDTVYRSLWRSPVLTTVSFDYSVMSVDKVEIIGCLIRSCDRMRIVTMRSCRRLTRSDFDVLDGYARGHPTLFGLHVTMVDSPMATVLLSRQLYNKVLWQQSQDCRLLCALASVFTVQRLGAGSTYRALFCEDFVRLVATTLTVQ